MAEKRLIDLYPYTLNGKKISYLLFKRAADRIYDGQWRMIGGKVQNGESYWEAAYRELREETSLKPLLMWTIPSVNSFYEHQTDTILNIPAFAAEIDESSPIILDSEHSEYAWFSIEDAVDKIIWPEQRRLLKLTDSLITSNQILEDWHVPIS